MESVRSWFKKLMSPDHRKAERLHSPRLVAYYWDGSVPTAHPIRNISSTGFYLLTSERWHPGTVVTMTLQRNDGPSENTNTQHYISVMSKVVRLGRDGVAFAFVPLEDRSSGQEKMSKARPAGKKDIGRFLEYLKLDEGCAVAGGTATKEALGQDEGLETPGDDL